MGSEKVLMQPTAIERTRKKLNLFERYLSLWVGACMLAGILLGKMIPAFTDALRHLEFGKGSQINVPIAILIWLIITPMMMKVDFTSIRNVGKRPRGWRRHQFECSADMTKKENGLCLPVSPSNFRFWIVT